MKGTIPLYLSLVPDYHSQTARSDDLDRNEYNWRELDREEGYEREMLATVGLPCSSFHLSLKEYWA